MKNIKCEICKTKKEVQFYEIREKETDKILASGNFCPTCIVVIASRAKSATFKFEDEDVMI